MKKTILFMLTNGAGLGHLTRGLAVATKLLTMGRDYQIIILTTSAAAHILESLPVQWYYVAPRQQQLTRMTNAEWNRILKDELTAIIELHHVDLIVFDGACPYAAVLDRIIHYKKIKAIWIKREGDKSGFESLGYLEKLFDQIIIPEEVGGLSSLEGEGRRIVSPIIYEPEKERTRKNHIRKELGISKEESLCYVQLGAGNINEIKSWVTVLLNELIKQGNYVLLGESIIGESFDIEQPQVKKIRHYPNSIYFEEVDFAISAAGYNTFHELLYYKVPSIFIPNENTTKDDQVARAKRAEKLQVGLCIRDQKELESALMHMKDKRHEFVKKLGQLDWKNGAKEAAEIIMHMI